jgi:O-antigen ligase
MALLAIAIFSVLIFILLKLTREPGSKRSAAVWIVFAWLWFASSRNPTLWLQPKGAGGRQAGNAYDEGNSLDRNILTLILLSGVIVLATRPRPTMSFFSANIPMLLFFLYCLVSVAWSEHPDISIRRWFRSLGDLTMVGVILTDTDWAAAFRWVYTRLAFLLVPLSIMFFRYFPNLGRAYSIHDGHVSATGVTDDKNALGMICMLFSLTVLWAMLDVLAKNGPRKKAFLYGYGAILVMAVYLIIIANSATATACLILGGAVLVLASRPKIAKRPVLIHLMVGVMLSVSAFSLLAGTALVEVFGRNSTLTGRTELWARCLSLVTNPLFGEGYESFWLGWRLEKMWEYIHGVNQAHNGYLEIYLNLGWVGVGFLVIMLIWGYRHIVRAVKRCEPAATLRLAFFVAVCIYNVTEAGFKMVHPMWIALLMSAAVRPAMGFVTQRAEGYEKPRVKLSETRNLAKALPNRRPLVH